MAPDQSPWRSPTNHDVERQRPQIQSTRCESGPQSSFGFENFAGIHGLQTNPMGTFNLNLVECMTPHRRSGDLLELPVCILWNSESWHFGMGLGLGYPSKFTEVHTTHDEGAPHMHILIHIVSTTWGTWTHARAALSSRGWGGRNLRGRAASFGNRLYYHWGEPMGSGEALVTPFDHLTHRF